MTYICENIKFALNFTFMKNIAITLSIYSVVEN